MEETSKVARSNHQEQRVEVFKVIQQERVSERVVEQFVALPQIQEHVAEGFKVIPQEQVSERKVELIVAVPQIQEHSWLS